MIEKWTGGLKVEKKVNEQIAAVNASLTEVY